MKNNIVLLFCIFETSDDIFMVSKFWGARYILIISFLTHFWIENPESINSGRQTLNGCPLPHFEEPDLGLCCFAMSPK